MKVHWLRLRAVVHPTEDLDRVGAAVQRLSGLDDEAFEKATDLIPIDSSHGGTVHYIETEIHRARDIRAALATLVPEPASYAAEIEARTDDDGVFYLRFGKQDAVQGQLVPTRSEDAIQVRLKPEVHPAKREHTVAALSAWAGL